jgi:hypothetical protein
MAAVARLHTLLTRGVKGVVEDGFEEAAACTLGGSELRFQLVT